MRKLDFMIVLISSLNTYTLNWVSESGRGRGHSYYLLALWLDYVHVMGFAMETSRERMMAGGGGGTLSSPTSFGLGISAPTPNFRVLFGTGRGHSSILSSEDQTKGDLKANHLQAWVTLTHSTVCPPPPPYSHLFRCFPIMHYRIYSQYHILRGNIFRALTASSGGGGAAEPPHPPTPLDPALVMTDFVKGFRDNDIWWHNLVDYHMTTTKSCTFVGGRDATVALRF